MQFSKYKHGGDEEDRTPDPLRARQVLSQLSYTPTFVDYFSTTKYIISSLSNFVNIQLKVFLRTLKIKQ